NFKAYTLSLMFVVKDEVLLFAITLEERADFQEKLVAERAGFEEKLTAERQLMQQTLMETLKSIGFSQTPTETKKVVDECSPKVIVDGSVKGSCSVAPANIKEDSDS
ncbi:Ulp1 protease family carboxy-terminal domain protein, partial [Trifolium medium]|nr:Ulp1 protease family carboxy-terminal domain protein [Trifolium medium]